MGTVQPTKAATVPQERGEAPERRYTMNLKDTKLTPEEMRLLALYRQLDGKRQSQMLKAAQALKVSAEHKSRYAI